MGSRARERAGGPANSLGSQSALRATSEVNAVLAKSRGENFPVALRVLPAEIRQDLQALYQYARYVDDIGDEASGDRAAALDHVADGVRAMCDGGDGGADPILGALAPTVRRRRLPADPLLRLVDANRQDQTVSRYATFDDLVAYCRLSANPVGELVLHVFDRATPERVALSDRICTALQVVEHLQDVGEDYRRGRVYLPHEDLERFGVAEEDLGAAVARPALRDLIAFETDRAEAWLDAGASLVSSLCGWSRLAVSGYLAGGRAACAALQRCGYDPLRHAAKATSGMVLAAWVRGSGRLTR